MIEAKAVSYKIGQHNLLDEVSICIHPGKLTAVVGPNGAGKSTLLRILSGELSPTTGDVCLMKRPLSQWQRKEVARHRAVLPQQVNLSFGFSALEVVLMGRTPHSKGHETSSDLQIATAALQKVGCAHFADRAYPTLSGGEQQRVQMARVLAQIWEQPNERNRYLLLDEPTNNLDLTYQHSMLQLAQAFANAGTAVFAILHDINLATQYADQIVMMENGRVVAVGTPDQVITAERIGQVFALPVQIIPHPQQAYPLVLPNVQTSVLE